MSQPGAAAGDVEILSEQECSQLMRSFDLGRIGLLDEQMRPLILPVNYHYEEGVIAFRTGPGTKLALAPGTYVCFEIDGWNPDTGVGWSVVARGFARDVTEPRGSPAARIHYWPVQPLAPGERGRWVGVWVSEISGRRFQGSKAG